MTHSLVVAAGEYDVSTGHQRASDHEILREDSADVRRQRLFLESIHVDADDRRPGLGPDFLLSLAPNDVPERYARRPDRPDRELELENDAVRHRNSVIG